jgi:translation initiation factor 1 (eIF-1/SUI1)
MGKKDKRTGPLPVGETPQLTHSPFAALNVQPTSAAERPAASDRAAAEAPARKPVRARLVLRRETKRRAGKAVIVISGFDALPAFDAQAIESLARECRHKLGCGGSVDGGEILLQGDRAAEVAALLRDMGFRVDGVGV